MKIKLKRLLSILLIFCMMVSTFSMFAIADEDTSEDTTSDQTTEETENTADSEETADGDAAAEGEAADEADSNIKFSKEAVEKVKKVKDNTDTVIPSRYVLARQNKNLGLYIDYNTGEFALYNKKTKAIWYSTVQNIENEVLVEGEAKDNLKSIINVTYVNAQFKTLSVSSANSSIICETKGNDIIFTFSFGEDQYFDIPVKYSLSDDHFSVEVLADSIEENSESRIAYIDVLPNFGAAKLTDDGYSFIPDGSGALLKFNQYYQNMKQYDNWIYGSDLSSFTDEQLDNNKKITMPVFGMVKNSNGFLGIISQGDAAAKIIACPSRFVNSFNMVYSNFRYRNIKTRKSASGTGGRGIYLSESRPENFIVRYYPLDKEKSDYKGMAEKYRSYLIKEKGLKKLETKSGTVNLTLLGSIKKDKQFLGIPYSGVESLTTYNQAKEIIEAFTNNGIDNLNVIYSGWQKGGLDGKTQTSLKAASNLGGTKNLKSLIKLAEEKNVNLMFDVDARNFYKGSFDLSTFSSISYGLDRSPINTFEFSEVLAKTDSSGDFSRLIHPSLYNKVVTKFVNSASKLGVKNFSFSTLGDTSFSAYNTDNVSIRTQSVKYIQEALKTASEKSENFVSASSGNEYLSPYANNFTDVSLYSSRIYFANVEVPFYQMVMHGYANLSGDPINLSSEYTECLLKTAAYGMSLGYTLMGAESTALVGSDYEKYYSSNYKDHLDSAASAYSRLKAVYNAVGNSDFVNYETPNSLTSISTFSNGAKVYVNYSDKQTTINGVKVSANDFVVVGGAK